MGHFGKVGKLFIKREFIVPNLCNQHPLQFLIQVFETLHNDGTYMDGMHLLLCNCLQSFNLFLALGTAKLIKEGRRLLLSTACIPTINNPNS